MANHIFILATVMLLAGIFGGLVNYYLYGDKDPDAASLPRFLVVGVGASFLVPVILDMVNSELVLESQGDPSRFTDFYRFLSDFGTGQSFLHRQPVRSYSQ